VNYLEPFGGGASVLLRKTRSRGEIYNDLDREVVDLFRVLRDVRMAAELVRRLDLTPFAREEFELSYGVDPDPVENARRLLVRCNMGVGATAVALRRRTGFRVHSLYRQKSYAEDWEGLPQALPAITERLKGVVIENRPALELLARFDDPSTLAYCDPPYVHAARSGKRIRGQPEHAYLHEMTDQAHGELLGALLEARSMIVLSGYASELYDVALQGWRRVEIPALADGARPRMEILWINPAAVAASNGLFDRLPAA
jgi:DNA adenine methylase